MLQTAKGYYSYRNSNIAKVNLNGKLSLAYITPREISETLVHTTIKCMSIHMDMG